MAQNWRTKGPTKIGRSQVPIQENGQSFEPLLHVPVTCPAPPMPTIWLVNLATKSSFASPLATMKVLKWPSTDLTRDTVYICIYKTRLLQGKTSTVLWLLLIFKLSAFQQAIHAIGEQSPDKLLAPRIPAWFLCHCNYIGTEGTSHFPPSPARTSQWISGELEVAELHSAHKYWSLRNLPETETASWK